MPDHNRSVFIEGKMNHNADSLQFPAVRLGVTGHQFLEDLSALTKACEEAMQMVEERYPNRKILLYSALSAGADHLAAEIALKIHLPLVAIVPQDQDTYVQGMSPDYREEYQNMLRRSTQQIAPSGVKGQSPYQSIENFLVENMDCLIAFWNGKEARGPGGTGDVVKKFDNTLKPWIWVRTQNMAAGNPQRLEEGLIQGSILAYHWQ